MMLANPTKLELVMSEHLNALGYMSEEQLAKLRGLQVGTLRNERAAGKGPPYAKQRNTIVYPIDGVKRWLEAGLVQPEGASTLSTGFSRRRRSAGNPRAA